MNKLTLFLSAMTSAQRSASCAVSSRGGICAGVEKGSGGQECIGSSCSGWSSSPGQNTDRESAELNVVKGYERKLQGRTSHAGFVAVSGLMGVLAQTALFWPCWSRPRARLRDTFG